MKLFKLIGFLLVAISLVVILGLVVGFGHKLWFVVDIVVIIVCGTSGLLLLAEKT